MPLRPRSPASIPAATRKIAWAGRPKGTPALPIRDRPGEPVTDANFTDPYPTDGRPGPSPARLALGSILQFAQNPSDRAAAEAVRTRIDCKYALGLEPDDPGFDHSVPCEFRARVCAHDAADRPPGMRPTRLVEAGPLTGRGRARTDATHVPAAARTLEPAGAGRRKPARPRRRPAKPMSLAGPPDRTGMGQAVRAESPDRSGARRQARGRGLGRDPRAGRTEALHRLVVPLAPARPRSWPRVHQLGRARTAALARGHHAAGVAAVGLPGWPRGALGRQTGHPLGWAPDASDRSLRRASPWSRPRPPRSPRGKTAGSSRASTPAWPPAAWPGRACGRYRLPLPGPDRAGPA
jgi:hypothetical protein